MQTNAYTEASNTDNGKQQQLDKRKYQPPPSDFPPLQSPPMEWHHPKENIS